MARPTERNPERQALHTSKAKGEITAQEYRQCIQQLDKAVVAEKVKTDRRRGPGLLTDAFATLPVQKQKGLLLRLAEFMTP